MPLNLLVAVFIASSPANAETSATLDPTSVANKSLCSYLKDVEAKTDADCTTDSIVAFKSKAPANLGQIVAKRKSDVQRAYEYFKAPMASADNEKNAQLTQLRPPINERTFPAWIDSGEREFKDVYAHWLRRQSRQLERERAGGVSLERRKEIDAALAANEAKVDGLRKITDPAKLSCFLGENCEARASLVDPMVPAQGGRSAWTSSDYERANRAGVSVHTVPGGKLDRAIPDVADPASNSTGDTGTPLSGIPLNRLSLFGGIGLALGWLASRVFESDARAATFPTAGATLGLVTALATSPGSVGRPAFTNSELIRGFAPNVAQAPGGRPDCLDQLKKTRGLSDDAEKKRQTTIVMLRPVLDKYHLSFDQFQAAFPRLLSGDVAICDQNLALCQLRMESHDWTAAQATYSQVQALDRRLLFLSGLISKLSDICALPNSDNEKPSEKNGAYHATEDDKAIDGHDPSIPNRLTDEEKDSIIRKAQQWQGKGDYPGIDRFRVIILKKGETIYGGAPGQSEFYTTGSTLKKYENDASTIFGALQVKSLSGFHRPGLTEYVLKEDAAVAIGITRANPHWGAGGATQIYIENYKEVLEPVKTFLLKNTNSTR